MISVIYIFYRTSYRPIAAQLFGALNARSLADREGVTSVTDWHWYLRGRGTASTRGREKSLAREAFLHPTPWKDVPSHVPGHSVFPYIKPAVSTVRPAVFCLMVFPSWNIIGPCKGQATCQSISWWVNTPASSPLRGNQILILTGNCYISLERELPQWAGYKRLHGRAGTWLSKRKIRFGKWQSEWRVLVWRSDMGKNLGV